MVMVKPGPSRIYLRLLRGAVTSERYVAVLKRWVEMQMGVSHTRARR